MISSTYDVRVELMKVVKSLNNDAIKAWTIGMLDIAPVAFWEKAASSTGKYHRADENGAGGQVMHTLRVCAMVDHLVRMDNLPVIERDMLLSAAILHDICKYGENGESEHTLLEHPQLAVFLWAAKKKELPVCEKDSEIMSIVSQHSGRWTSISNPSPSKLGKLLHIADFVASRHNVDVRLDK